MEFRYQEIKGLTARYPALEGCGVEIERAVTELIQCYERGNQLLVCGNGGSAADAQHIVGELMKGFRLPRRLSEAQRKEFQTLPGGAELAEQLQQPFPAHSLGNETALLTAFSNDRDPAYVYAQQVYGYGRRGDVFLGISTSGNSANVIHAARTAKARGLTVLSLTGRSSGGLRQWSDLVIAVPAEEAGEVQELHLPVYHAICAAVEAQLFSETEEE